MLASGEDRAPALETKKNAIIAEKEYIFSAITTICDYFKSLTAGSDIFLAKAKLERANELKVQFNLVQSKIILFNAELPNPKKDGIEYTSTSSNINDACDVINGQFLKLQDKYQTKIAASNPPSTKTESTINISMPFVPSVKINQFSGKFKEWNQFISLYESVIHKSDKLSDVEKFQYLRSYLAGDALKLIESYDLDNANYAVAYKVLKERYSNPRILANTHLNGLLGYKPMTSINHASLQGYLNAHVDGINSYKKLDIADHYDYLLFQVCYQHLDKRIQREFDKKYSASKFPSYADLMSFVQSQLRSMELHSEDVEPKPTNVSSSSTSKKLSIHALKVSENKDKQVYHAQAKQNEEKSLAPICPLCPDLNHRLYSCPKFKTMNTSERYEALKTHRKCFNCFGNHSRDSCKNANRCKTCNKAHHSMLHSEAPKTAEQFSVQCNSSSTNEKKVLTIVDNQSILLATACAYVRSAKTFKLKPVRILIDPGSQVTCVTKECIEDCSLPMKQANTPLKGIAGSSARVLGTVSLNLLPSPKSSTELRTAAIVLPQITSKLPAAKIDKSVLQRFKSEKLADPGFAEPSKIDVLLGADLYPEILIDKPPIRGNPSGIFTIFGLTLVGPAPLTSNNLVNYSHLTTFDSLEKAISQFWRTEEVPNCKFSSPETEFCERFFTETTQRDPEGRYIVALPFHTNPHELGSNRSNALKRLHTMERKFSTKPELLKEYVEFMKEYQKLNHMQITSDPSEYVIPHHAVFKNSTTTHLRVVFDASNKTDRNSSMNDFLCKGSKLQQDITIIVSNFRTHKIAVTADIKMMYRQILIRPEDRKYQHIFWRNSTIDKIQEYELNTVTYGMAPSSFLSQRVLKQLVQDEGKIYPLASTALQFHTYVDDIVTGAPSEEQALALHQELVTLLGKGGFFPRKWSSSSKTVLEGIPQKHRESPLIVHSGTEHAYKILGLAWDPNLDSFFYNNHEFVGQATKRTVLSFIARIFDPLGWLAPFVFSCKYFMQRLWQHGLAWDEPLPEPLKGDWQNLIANLNSISEIRIPRNLNVADSNSFQLIGFCDASQIGYACALYFRCQSETDCKINIIAAKTKVAPLKLMTIPRLELNAAYLLMKLYMSMQSFIESLPSHQIIFFSDSKVVLSWLRTPPFKLKTYVANRVVEIIENLPPDIWYHVQSENNAADCASRGLKPDQLANHSIWWHGPSFLQNLELKHFNSSNALPPEHELPEMKSFHSRQEPIVPTEILDRFSSLVKMQRVMAYVFRFINSSSRKTRISSSKVLTVKELRDSLNCCIKLTQSQYFSKELKLLNQSRFVPSLRMLSPILDENGLIRVGGRLSNAPLSRDAKHPILLPKTSSLAKLICEHYHILTIHGGSHIMRAAIQQKYWITGIGSLIRSCIFSCLNCYKRQGTPPQPPMADLPPSRFAQVRAFLRTGVDYAGPYSYRETSRRNSSRFKGYICLFVCLSTKAVHLELVTELTTSAFLAALTRFVSRRGLCTHLHSDNGTNFVGASRELNAIKDFLAASSSVFEQELAQRQIEWVFNPPAAPHFGGLWEANIKSMKHHLSRVLENRIFTQEELTTILCRIEAVLNSRPLCGTSSDLSSNACFLTPGHFLIGDTLLAVPELPLRDVQINRLNRWQLIQQSIQQFWKLWKTSYLQTLISRKKWQLPSKPLQIGDVVILKSINTPPQCWPIGRISNLFPDKSGISRVAKIWVQSRFLTRPINSLLPIPTEKAK